MLFTQIPRRARVVALLIALASSVVARTEEDVPNLRAYMSERPTLKQLNLSASFERLILDRMILDGYAQRQYRTEAASAPQPVEYRRLKGMGAKNISVFEPRSGVGVRIEPIPSKHNSSLRRGIQAPVTDESEDWLRSSRYFQHNEARSVQAIRTIENQLAHAGLLRTLVEVIELLGPERFIEGGPGRIGELYALGFPVDLVACFSAPGYSDTQSAATEVVQRLAALLVNGADRYALESEMNPLRFHVPDFWPRFRVAEESGIHNLGLVRLQVGGGIDRGGISPGGTVHVARQLITGLPNTDFLIAVPEFAGKTFVNWAKHTLPRASNQHFSIVLSQWHIDSWAQDNGKAGTLLKKPGNPPELVTAVPRYASRDEGRSTFLAEESFVIRELKDSGHNIVQLPLMFQGGNLMPVFNPATGERILLIGEGAIHRNTALGLTQLQVLQLFERLFDVDECRMIPALSYHLDFDLTVREIDGELVVFVNDPLPAVRTIIETGVRALHTAMLLPTSTAERLDDALKAGRATEFHRTIETVLANLRRSDRSYPATVAETFKANRQDLGEGNFEVLLQALDLHLVLHSVNHPGGIDPDRRAYLMALTRWNRVRVAQRAAIERLGWKVIGVPSLPDLHRGINYVNGIQHKGGYVMPAYGGFYSSLDTQAEQVFRSVIGEERQILTIRCAELQRLHGAIHCVAAAYPALED